MTSTNLPPNIILAVAQPSDIPAIHEVGTAAFADDTHTEMKNLVKGTDASVDGGMIAYLTTLVDHPRVDLIVAKTIDSDEIVGYVAWARHNLDKPFPTSDYSSLTWGPTPSPPPIPDHTPLGVKELEEITNKSMNDWQSYLSRDGEDVKCRLIAGMSVLPSYQGKGIGKAMMRWGTEKADEEGIHCWVQGSMGSKGAYEAGGFKEVGRLELDLDLFSEGSVRPVKEGGEEDHGGKWGMYFWPYMRRDPAQRVRTRSL